jgi:NADH-quinone oxidoreductase subunit M
MRLFKIASLYLSFFIIWFFLVILFLWDNSKMNFQFSNYIPLILNLNINFCFGLDIYSLFFILLTVIIIPLVFLSSWYSVKYRVIEFFSLIFLIEFFLIGLFFSLDFLTFFSFFEILLLPLFCLIGLWGSRSRKIFAAYQFFLFTFFGSLFFLTAIFIFYKLYGTFDLEILFFVEIPVEISKLLWFLIFFPLAIKIPMFPLHIWLPEAHVEAPTAGSVLLAGILLKLGTYGIIRFIFPLLYQSTNFFLPYLNVFIFLALFYTSLIALRQIDLKKIIAYSSVVHMNFLLLGLFSGTYEGFEGSFFLMLSHGIISSGLFFCIGFLYDRYKSRIIFYYGGLVQLMPLWSLFLFLFILGNISFPFTSNFIGEFLVLIGLSFHNFFMLILALLSLLSSTAFSLWCLNRTIFGPLTTKINFYCDLTKREFLIVFVLTFLMFFLGIFPNSIFFFTWMKLIF